MKARIYVTLKKGVLDPQGKAIENALHLLGYDFAKDVRQGKFFEMELGEIDKNQAGNKLKEMCEKLLANLVIEDYDFDMKNE